MNESLHEIKSVIAGRRSIKPEQYTGEPVPDAFIDELLNAANWAPTHGFTEPWRFCVFSGDGLRKLGDFLAEQDQPDQNAEDFNQVRFDRLRERPLKASHVIGIGLHPGNNPKVPEVEEVCSVAMAVQNMWLLASAMGLGAYWSTGSAAFTEEMRDFFGLPEGDRSLGLFYIGKPAGSAPSGRRLTDAASKTRWVR